MGGRSKYPETDGAGEKVDETRREALVKIARFSAYTAPTLLVMLTGASYAQADSITPG